MISLMKEKIQFPPPSLPLAAENHCFTPTLKANIYYNGLEHRKSDGTNTSPHKVSMTNHCCTDVCNDASIGTTGFLSSLENFIKSFRYLSTFGIKLS